jgi:hypothetical protein
MAGKFYYKVWCEYDVGQEYYIFSDVESAWIWVKKALAAQGINPEEAIEEGLVGYDHLELDPGNE